MAVDSANTVGYSDVAVAAGKFCIIGTQFTQVGAVNISIADLVQGDFAPATYTTRTTAAPQILVLNADGETYMTYYYIDDAEDDDENEVTGWANNRGDLVETAIGVGKGFWLKLPTAGTVTATFTL